MRYGLSIYFMLHINCIYLMNKIIVIVILGLGCLSVWVFCVKTKTTYLPATLCITTENDTATK